MKRNALEVLRFVFPTDAEIRRLVIQGAISINGVPTVSITDGVQVAADYDVQVGKNKWLRVREDDILFLHRFIRFLEVIQGDFIPEPISIVGLQYSELFIRFAPYKSELIKENCYGVETYRRYRFFCPDGPRDIQVCYDAEKNRHTVSALSL